MMTRRYNKAPRFGGGLTLVRVMAITAACIVIYIAFMFLFITVVNAMMDCDASLWTQSTECVTLQQVMGL